ncbi:hypothetical protein EYF80_067555 [Liparis tanakae]|uniref:Uncharacterized protein n=1 Tax=Liparis tanakae TaxID=230148 RepID=A0A4Z2E0L7_9TELE|nr:hypothetical protein EYF80_067555 [Liparis tanakae]
MKSLIPSSSSQSPRGQYETDQRQEGRVVRSSHDPARPIRGRVVRSSHDPARPIRGRVRPRCSVRSENKEDDGSYYGGGCFTFLRSPLQGNGGETTATPLRGIGAWRGGEAEDSAGF